MILVEPTWLNWKNELDRENNYDVRFEDQGEVKTINVIIFYHYAMLGEEDQHSGENWISQNQTHVFLVKHHLRKTNYEHKACVKFCPGSYSALP